MLSADLLRDGSGPDRLLHPDAATEPGCEKQGRLVTVSFNGVSGEAVVKLDETISVAWR
jgi:hypothetical protein